MASFEGVANTNVSGTAANEGEGNLTIHVGDAIQVLKIVAPENEWAWCYNEQTGHLGYVDMHHIDRTEREAQYEERNDLTEEMLSTNVSDKQHSHVRTRKASLELAHDATIVGDLLAGETLVSIYTKEQLETTVSTLCREVRASRATIHEQDDIIREKETSRIASLREERQKSARKCNLLKSRLDGANSAAVECTTEITNLKVMIRKLRRRLRRGNWESKEQDDEMNDIDVLTSSTGTAGNDGNDVGDGSAGTGTAGTAGTAVASAEDSLSLISQIPLLLSQLGSFANSKDKTSRHTSAEVLIWQEIDKFQEYTEFFDNEIKRKQNVITVLEQKMEHDNSNFEKNMSIRDEKIAELEKRLASTIEEAASYKEAHEKAKTLIVQQKNIARKKLRRASFAAEGLSGQSDAATSPDELARRPRLMPEKNHWVEGSNSSRRARSRKKEKSADLLSFLVSSIKANLMFVNKSPAFCEVCAKLFRRAVARKGEILFCHGDIGDDLFIIDTGVVQIVTQQENYNKQITTGGSFGEMALMHSTSRRNADVLAVTDCVFYLLSRSDFRNASASYQKKNLQQRVVLLSKIPMLTTLAPSTKLTFANAMKTQEFVAGSFIFHELDVGRLFYIVQAGTIEIVKANDSGENKVVQVLNAGQSFGERALTGGNNVRAAGARVSSDAPATLVSLSQNHFLKMLETLVGTSLTFEKQVAQFSTMQNIDNRDENRNGKLLLAEGYHMQTGKRSNSVSFSHTSIVLPKLKSLQIFKIIGKGAFGKVYAVQGGTKMFAMKRVSKTMIDLQGKIDHLHNERAALMDVQSEFVTRLFGTYNDRSFVYMMLDYCAGGDMFSLLSNSGARTEDAARFYAANVICGLQVLHEHNICHRDLKTENILINENGYLKIGDLGICKMLPENDPLTYTIVGTPSYMAPEMIQGEGHGLPVDLWAMGIFLFEILTTSTPFHCDDVMDMYHNIMHDEIDVTSYTMTDRAGDLAHKLLFKDPVARLGCGARGFDQVKSHAWFQEMDWSALENQLILPPHIPKLNASEDFSWFEDYGELDVTREVAPFAGDDSMFDNF